MYSVFSVWGGSNDHFSSKGLALLHCSQSSGAGYLSLAIIYAKMCSLNSSSISSVITIAYSAYFAAEAGVQHTMHAWLEVTCTHADNAN
jgi:hypothetical protein